GQHFRVGSAQHDVAGHFRQRDLVFEGRVAEANEVIERIVTRMIDPGVRVLGLAAGSDAATAMTARSRCCTLTFVSGSVTPAATWLTMCCSEWLPPVERKPRALVSELRYNTAFSCSSLACVSAHSVDPRSIGSSPSQLAYTMVRLGTQPCRCRAPNALASPMSATVPASGSQAPYTQPSW